MHCEAVAGFVKQLKGSPATAQVLAAQKLHIEGMVAQADLSVAQAGRIMAALGEIPWGDGVLAELTQMIAQRTLCAPSLPQLGRSRLQDYRSLVHYFSEPEWAQLSSERVLSHCKLELVLGRSISLALRNPTEATLQAIASLHLACAEGFQKACNLNAQLKYNTLQHVKKVFKSMHKPPLAHAILQLPASPSDLAKSYPALWSEVFEKQPPTDAKVSTIELEALGQTIPMRSTSRLMVSGSAPSAQQEHSQMMGFMSMLQRMMGDKEVGGSIPIQFYPRRAKALPALAPALGASAGARVPEALPKEEAPENEEEEQEEEAAEEEQEPVELPSAKPGKLSVAESTRMIAERIKERKRGGVPKAAAKSAPNKGAEKSADPQAAAKKKVVKKTAPKAAANPVVKKTAPKTAAKKVVRKTAPTGSIHVEWSRQQVQCRGALLVSNGLGCVCVCVCACACV